MAVYNGNLSTGFGGARGASTSTPYGVNRGILQDLTNGEAVAYEDWMRGEISADNALNRDLEYMEKANLFTADEAQKNRDWEERMSNTAYQRAVEDMKKAGINPLLAVNSSGAYTPAGGFSGSTGNRTSGRTPSSSPQDSGSLLNFLGHILSGLISRK